MVSVDVTNISIQPDTACPIDAELKLGIDFTIDAPLAAARWEIRYVADHAHRRHVIDIDKTPPAPLGPGTHHFQHEVKDFGVSGLKKSVIVNVGLLLAVLFDGDEEVIQVSMVTQVLEKDGALLRLVLNPLE